MQFREKQHIIIEVLTSEKENTMKKAFDYLLLLLANTAPFLLLSYLFYESGIAIMLMFPALQSLLNILNYDCTKRLLSFVFLNIAMLISSIAGHEITTRLYYNNISSDSETLAVGEFAVYACIVFVAVMTLISIICKAFGKTKNK